MTTIRITPPPVSQSILNTQKEPKANVSRALNIASKALETSAASLAYKEELNKHPTRLIDSMLECAEMDPDMVGATCLFKDANGNQYSFSIKSRQINDTQKQAE